MAIMKPKPPTEAAAAPPPPAAPSPPTKAEAWNGHVFKGKEVPHEYSEFYKEAFLPGTRVKYLPRDNIGFGTVVGRKSTLTFITPTEGNIAKSFGPETEISTVGVPVLWDTPAARDPNAKASPQRLYQIEMCVDTLAGPMPAPARALIETLLKSEAPQQASPEPKADDLPDPDEAPKADPTPPAAQAIPPPNNPGTVAPTPAPSKGRGGARKPKADPVPPTPPTEATAPPAEELQPLPGGIVALPKNSHQVGKSGLPEINDLVAIEGDIGDDAILGLTNNGEVGKLMGLTPEFNAEKFVALVKKLPELVGLPTEHDMKLVAHQIQIWSTDIGKFAVFFEWAVDEAKTNYKVWRTGAIRKAYNEALSWYREAKKQYVSGAEDRPEKPTLDYVTVSIDSSRINQRYLQAINRYNYWRMYIHQLGTKSIDRKSMMAMSINRRSVNTPTDEMLRAAMSMGSGAFAEQIEGPDLPDAEDPPAPVVPPSAPPAAKAPVVISKGPAAPVPAPVTLPTGVSPAMLALYPWMARFPKLVSGNCGVCMTMVQYPDGKGTADVRNNDGTPHAPTCSNPRAQAQKLAVVDQDLPDPDDLGAPAPQSAPVAPVTKAPAPIGGVPPSVQSSFNLDD